jgi:hypothetical protein
MISEMTQARHAEERGAILHALQQDYTHRMTSLRVLGHALFLTGCAITPDGLRYHLSLLEASGYLRLWRQEDMPGFRTDREMGIDGAEIAFAKLLPKGMQLIDGQIAADPSVSF